MAESEKFGRAMIEHSPLGISVRDAKGRLLSVNPAWLEIWQISAETVEEYLATDKTVLMFDEKDSYLGDWLPEVEKIYKEGGRLTIPELKLTKHRSGRERWVSQTFYALLDGNGAVDRVVILTNDITARKRAEEALQKSEEIFRTIVTNAQPIIFMTDSEGTFVLSEGKMLATLGLEPGQAVGLSAFEMYQDYPAVIKGLKDALRGKSSVGIVEVNESTFDVFWSPYRGPSGEIGGVIGMAIDITEHKAAQEELRRKNVALGEILHQISADQDAVKQQIATNIEEAVLPVLARLKETANPAQTGLVELLQRDLQDIASPFLDTLRHRYAKLTPRETELCRLIRGGMSSKEIAETLNLSLGTVHKHREMIRRKLGLANEDINLATFLQSM